MDDKPVFNPTDYDYLDNAPLEQFIAEFLVRNQKFIKACKKLFKDKKLIKERGGADLLKLVSIDTEFFKKYKVYLPKDIDCKEIEKTKKLRVIIPKAVSAFRIFDRDRIGDNDEDNTDLMELEEKRNQWKKQGKKEELRLSGFSKGLHRDEDVEPILGYLLGEFDKDGYYPCFDTLLLAVNLNRPKEEIEKRIEKILKIHKKRRPVSERLDKWKYYLIVYDLKKKGMSYDEISDTLSKFYPENSNLFDERNIMSYYHKASELIKGDYKKYI